MSQLRAVRMVACAGSCLLLATCFSLPVWHGKIDVTPIERKAVTTCGTGALTDDGAKVITRSPYQQSVTTTTATLVWGSATGRGTVVLREPGDDAIVASVDATYAGDPDRGEARLAAQSHPGKELAADDIYVMKAPFFGLTSGHLYCYQVLSGGVALTEPAPIATAALPNAATPTRFIMIGDTGTGGAAQAAIAKQMTSRDFDFIVWLGDMAYEQGTPTQLQNYFFAVYRDILRYVPIYPTLGNHDRRTRRGKPYLEAFVLPEPERYYSFDWGDVHFVCIDTTQRDRAQLEWLDQDLADNKLPWVIAFGHHPPYTQSFRGPQLAVRRSFVKIFTAHKVDLVVTGHEHHYERFRVAGVHYVVSGGGGGQLTRIYGPLHPLGHLLAHHFLWFEATAHELMMKVVDIEGRVRETLHISKRDGKTTFEVNGAETRQSTPAPTPQQTVPDETVHDKPDDDIHEIKVEPPPHT